MWYKAEIMFSPLGRTTFFSLTANSQARNRFIKIPNRAATTCGSTIFTNPLIWKQHQKTTLRRTAVAPKAARSQRPPNPKDSRPKSYFRTARVCTVFSCRRGRTRESSQGRHARRTFVYGRRFKCPSRPITGGFPLHGFTQVPLERQQL